MYRTELFWMLISYFLNPFLCQPNVYLCCHQYILSDNFIDILIPNSFYLFIRLKFPRVYAVPWWSSQKNSGNLFSLVLQPKQEWNNIPSSSLKDSARLPWGLLKLFTLIWQTFLDMAVTKNIFLKNYFKHCFCNMSTNCIKTHFFDKSICAYLYLCKLVNWFIPCDVQGSGARKKPITIHSYYLQWTCPFPCTRSVWKVFNHFEWMHITIVILESIRDDLFYEYINRCRLIGLFS